MRLLNDADFESNHFFKATRPFIASCAAERPRGGADQGTLRGSTPFPCYHPMSAHAAQLTRARRGPP